MAASLPLNPDGLRRLVRRVARSPLLPAPVRVAVDRLQRQRVRRLIAPELINRKDTRFTSWAGTQRLAVSVPDVDTQDAAFRNLIMVLDLLDARRIEYSLVRTRNRDASRLMVFESDRDEVLDALRTLGRTRPVYLRLHVGDDPPTGPRLASQLPTEGSDQISMVEAWQFFSAQCSPLRVAWGSSCQIEFWRRTSRALVASHPNRVATRIPTDAPVQTVVVGDRTVPIREPFAETQLEDVTFPIDVVYTWVNGEDPRWLARKQVALDLDPRTDDAAPPAISADPEDHPARYRSRDELLYSLRSVHRFAPWVRHIYLVTDDQRPSWLRDQPNLTVVDHRELFPDPTVLPTYNSHAIETVLHRVPGLSDHFIYLNDDVMLARPLQPQLFFLSNGMARFHLSRATIPLATDGADVPAHVHARQRTAGLLQDLVGRTSNQVLKHTPHPLRRDVMAELEDRLAYEFAQTATHRLRRPDDIVPVWLAHHYGYFTDRAAPGIIDYNYFDSSREPDQLAMQKLLGRRSLDVFCINDKADSAHTDQTDRMLGDFLAAYYPLPSPHERSSEGQQMRWSPPPVANVVPGSAGRLT